MIPGAGTRIGSHNAPSMKTPICILTLFLFPLSLLAQDPLPSWNEGAAKQSIFDFVRKVTSEDSADFVPAPERIATFDNDGTLWCEMPYYTQLEFAFDRVADMLPMHSEWEEVEPFKSALKKDLKGVLAGGEHALMQVLMSTHANTTQIEFAGLVSAWLEKARHPRFDQPYTKMIYQPMLEVLEYLRTNGFKTYIVSGGGIEFMRPWTEEVYGIPPEQVVGSSVKSVFEMREDGPVLLRKAELNFNDDKDGKPVAINQHIGRRPIAAFGNSDGDLQMLQWTAAGDGASFCLYVRHTDAEREYAYDRKSAVGKLDKGLDEAREKGWTVVDMKKDWKLVFGFN